MLSKILERFVEDSPITVITQTLMSRIFAPDAIDALFEKYATRQYQQDLLFSSLVDLMSTVVCGIHPSVSAAYGKKAKQVAVSTIALYNKLQGVETEVSQGLLMISISFGAQLMQCRRIVLKLYQPIGYLMTHRSLK